MEPETGAPCRPTVAQRSSGRVWYNRAGWWIADINTHEVYRRFVRYIKRHARSWALVK